MEAGMRPGEEIFHQGLRDLPLREEHLQDLMPEELGEFSQVGPRGKLVKEPALDLIQGPFLAEAAVGGQTMQSLPWT